MPESGPKTPDINQEKFVEPIGPITEIDVSHRRSLLSKASGYLALGLATLTANSAPAVAQESSVSAGAPAAASEILAGKVCVWNYLGGDPAAPCESVPVPPVCDPERVTELRHQLNQNYLYVSPNRQIAPVIVRNRARMSSTSEYKTKMRLGLADNGIRDNNRGQRMAQLWLSEQAGLKDIRMVIYPDLWKRFKQVYLQGIDAARACGKSVYVTLALARREWTGRRAYKYFRSVAKKMKGKVSEFGIGNEPNLEDPDDPQNSWLLPIGNRTLPESYRIIYRNAYRAINEVDPRNKAFIFESSSHAWPIKFMNSTLKCSTDNAAKNTPCPPLKADEVAIHTYMDIDSNDVGVGGDDLPRFGKTVNWRSKLIGLDKLPTVVKAVRRFCEQGRLVLAGAKKGCPPIGITEMAYEHRYVNGFELTDEAMSKLTAAGFAEACRNNMTRYYHYQLQTTPLDVKMRGDKWDSAIVNDTSLNLNPKKVQSVPSMTYFTFEAFAKSAIGKRCLQR